MLACGIYLLQAAWQSRKDHPLHLLSGWAMALIGSAIFTFRNGPEKGIALALVAFSILALIFLTLKYAQSASKNTKLGADRISDSIAVSAPVLVRRVCVFFLIALIAGLAALSLSTGVFALLRSFGMEHTINLVIVMFLFPLGWAGLAVLIGADKLLWRKSLVSFCAGALPLIYIVLDK